MHAQKYFSTYVFVSDSQHEIATLEVDLGDPRPEVVADLGSIPQDDDPARSEPEEVLDAILSLNKRER